MQDTPEKTESYFYAGWSGAIDYVVALLKKEAESMYVAQADLVFELIERIERQK